MLTVNIAICGQRVDGTVDESVVVVAGSHAGHMLRMC